MSDSNILSIRDIVKTYPGVVAIDHVSFDVREGEVHALIGENGAGKSTLIKVLSGAIQPDSGSITIGGKTFEAMTPILSKEQGIGVIYQEFTLVPGISAAENVFLGQKTSDGLFVNYEERIRRTKELFDQMHVNIDPTQPVRSLSPACQQIVEIAKAVSKNVRILIMDEPTAPLTVNEVDTLFQVIRDLKKKGVTLQAVDARCNPDHLLFATPDGRPIEANVLREHLAVLERRAGVTGLTFSAIRETAIRQALEDGGTDAEVMERFHCKDRQAFLRRYRQK